MYRFSFNLVLYQRHASINNTIDTGSASQKHKSPLQGIGCIHEPKSLFKVTVFRCQTQKKSIFYVVQIRPKLDNTIYIEISVLFSNIESHDIPYLSWGLVRDTLSS
jgi:hypothetical protein